MSIFLLAIAFRANVPNQGASIIIIIIIIIHKRVNREALLYKHKNHFPGNTYYIIPLPEAIACGRLSMGTAAVYPKVPSRRHLTPDFNNFHLSSAINCVTVGARQLWPHSFKLFTAGARGSSFVSDTSASAFAQDRCQPHIQRLVTPRVTKSPLPFHPGGGLWLKQQQHSTRTHLRPLHVIRGFSGGPQSSDVTGVSFFATCHPGLEEVVARELLDLGYMGVECSKAGVAFKGRRVSDGYIANLWLRSAIRVLVLLAEGELGTDPSGGMRGGQALYDMVYGAANWHEVIPPDRTFSVEPRLWSCTDISSTKLVWSRVKDAVCDSIRNHRREKPLPPEKGKVADVPLYVSCYRDHVSIFRDMSGQSLHRRGYRDVMHRAALNEAAAAGVLTLSGWKEAVEEAGNGEGLVLADPMCGSGTFLIEAALMARDIAPGFMRSITTDPPATASASVGTSAGRGGAGRRNAALAPEAWPFQRWGDYDPGAWSQAVDEARGRVRPPWRGRLLGVDVHEGAMSLAARQATMAGVNSMLELTLGDCGSVVPIATPHMVICNPPWGVRLDGNGYHYDSASPDDENGGGDDRHGNSSLEDSSRAAAFGGAYEASLTPLTGRRGGSSPSETTTPEQEAFLSTAWRSLDGFLYRQCPGAFATVVSGNPSAFRYLKLKPQSKHRLVLSGVEVQVASYKIRDATSRSSPSVLKHHVQSVNASDTPERRFSSDAGFSSSTSPHSSSTDSTVGAADRSPSIQKDTDPPAAMAMATQSKHAAHLNEGVTSAVPGAGGPAIRRRANSLAQPPPPHAAAPLGAAEYLDADDGYWLSD
ncbi:hypothetical protein VaNZ11_001050 [Volvox africanus]|uniref:Uncharacterized protein n=1 Tax=Volvox africanus TaxID=51714 RepID=A0ABQ5RQ40_9CHLO|nr:hypothetical protein VaNZ11_001050 [Volvox africanus]